MRKNRFFQVVAIASMLLFWVHVFAHIFNNGLQHDEAGHASSAKNWALGYGYASSFHEIYRFNPELSAGPVAIYPLVLLIRAFGNLYWLPRLYMSVLDLAMILIVFLFVRRISDASRAWKALFLFSICCWLFTSDLLFNWYDALRLWFEFMPDISTALLVCLGFFAAAAKPRSLLHAVTGAALIGLAVLGKLVVALAAPAYFAFVLVIGRNARRSREKAAGPAEEAGKLALSSVAIALPLVAWKLYVRLSVTPEELRRIADDGKKFFSNSGSGIGQFLSAPSRVGFILDHLRVNSRLWVDSVRSAAGLACFFALLGWACFEAWQGIRRKKGAGAADRRPEWLCLGMAVAGVIHIAWWLGFSTTLFVRHLIPGVMYALVAISLGLSRRATWRANAALLGLLALAFWPQRALLAEFLRNAWIPDYRRTYLEQALPVLAKLKQDPDAELLGCGNWANWEFEYLMPGVANFKDCWRIDEKDYSTKKVLLIHDPVFNYEHDPYQAQLKDYCEKDMVYWNYRYMVSRCRGPLPFKRPVSKQ